jgi:hypothetical protein
LLVVHYICNRFEVDPALCGDSRLGCPAERSKAFFALRSDGFRVAQRFQRWNECPDMTGL